MNTYLFALLYIALGLLGAYAHYFKKRYGDMTTNDSLRMYVFGNFPHTLYALGGILFTEITLASIQVSTNPSLPELLLALTTGYSANSMVNKASDAP